MTNRLLLMSVLNDISVQDGGAIRELAMNVSHTRARGFIRTLGKFDAHRMDSLEYSVDPKDDSGGAIRFAHAYWLDDDGHYNWGLPKGKWSDYCNRVLQEEAFWTADGYKPVTASEVGETLSRDLLLSNYVFPFHAIPDKANPIVQDGMVPLLASLDPSLVHFGSRSVFRLVETAGQRDQGDLGLFTRNLDNSCKFKEFAGFATAYGLATSTNWKDMKPAVRRCLTIDEEELEKGHAFLTLAGLANYLEAQMAQTHRRSRVMKEAIKWKEDWDEAADMHRYSKVFEVPVEDHSQAEYMNEIFHDSNSRGIGRIGERNGFRCLAASNVVIVKLNSHYHVLTKQDILSLKFAAVTHSMWHMYVGTISLEYEDTDYVAEVASGLSAEEEEARLNAKRLMESARSVLKEAGLFLGTARYQEEVPLAKLKDKLAKLWVWYQIQLSHAIKIGRQDCLGRYLNEVFSIYTAKLGGKHMAKTIPTSERDMSEEYDALGFESRYVTRELLAILTGMPQSAIQDFARISKIVPAYDVNPMYSYMDRAVRMRQQNPRGRATMTGDLTARIEGMTDLEHEMYIEKMKCSARVMLTVADVKSRALDLMTDDDRNEMGDEPYPVILAKLRQMQRSVSTSARLRIAPDLQVPSVQLADARAQALQLINDGRMPDNEWAGGFLDTTDTLCFMERGEPDLAILKATAIVSGDLYVAMSNVSGLPRMTPTRLNDGNKERGSGTMITDFLLDKFPSRREALAFVAVQSPVASTSDKIETVKWPFKTRVITSMCAEGRRIQGEYEYNNGKVLVHVPGFMVGVAPADRLKRTYAVLRQDVEEGSTRIYGSLDLSSFSQGMHWDVQKAINDVLYDAYGLDDSAQRKLEMCTLGAYMVRVEGNLRLFMVNSTGSNFEGLDGKRNTFMHCVLWYMARCQAYRKGVENPMRAFLYIDDGAFSLVEKDDQVDRTIRVVREALIEVYSIYGFKLNLSKTVISTSYMQFLNEIFLHGVHIGYGFRALCHTAAQSFPTAGSICEELAVIVGGIRGAGVAGGHSLRLFVGFAYLLWLYTLGVVGSKGHVLRTESPYLLATALWLPTIAGGFGLPSWTRLFSNLSGNRDCEKLDTIAQIAWVNRTIYPDRYYLFKAFVKTEMKKIRKEKCEFMPDRVTIAHPGTSRFGDLGRDVCIAEAALKMSRNPVASRLISEYLATGGRPQKGGVAEVLVKTITGAPVPLLMAYVEKALSAEPKAAIVTMITKVSSSFLIHRLLAPHEIRSFNRRYVASGRLIMSNLADSLL